MFRVEAVLKYDILWYSILKCFKCQVYGQQLHYCIIIF